MALSVSSLANDGMDHSDAAPADHGLAGALRKLGYAAIRPLRYRMLYHRIVGDLMRLDDDVLQEIGIARWDIAAYARSRAELRWPTRHSLRVVLGGVAAAVWRASTRGRERRMTARDLMVLDDRMLKDIGLTRSQIPWIANEVWRLIEVDVVTMACPPAAHDMARLDDRTRYGEQTSRIAANDGRMLRAS
jgi:uncharacterized protein YjiS (DUF1127 family)